MSIKSQRLFRFSSFMIQALQWFLIVEAPVPCQPVAPEPAFPIAHLWTQALREKADLRLRFMGLFMWSVQPLHADKWLGLLSSVWGRTRLQPCWDETQGGWCAPSPLHPSYLCTGFLPSLESLQTTLFPFHHHSVFPFLPLSSLHRTLQIYHSLYTFALW